MKVKLSAKESGVDEGNESLCPSHLCARVWKLSFRECLTDFRAGLQTLIYRTLDSPLCAGCNLLCLAFNTAEPDKTWFHTTSKALGQPQLRPPSFFSRKGDVSVQRNSNYRLSWHMPTLQYQPSVRIHWPLCRVHAPCAAPKVMPIVQENSVNPQAPKPRNFSTLTTKPTKLPTSFA